MQAFFSPESAPPDTFAFGSIEYSPATVAKSAPSVIFFRASVAFASSLTTKCRTHITPSDAGDSPYIFAAVLASGPTTRLRASPPALSSIIKFFKCSVNSAVSVFLLTDSAISSRSALVISCPYFLRITSAAAP